MSPPSPSDARARRGAYPAPFRRSSSHSELSSAGGSARSPPRRASLFATSRLEEEEVSAALGASSGDSSSDEASGGAAGAAARTFAAPDEDPAEAEQMFLFDLAVRMSGEVATKTRRRRLKTHADSFTGRQAVQWMLSANVAEDVEAALALGGGLVKAGLIKGPLGFESITSGTYASGTPSKTAASRTQSASHHGFANRSFLYRFNVAMDPGLRAARWCLSREMVKVRGSVYDVATVVDRHTAAARALADDHAAAMERLENVLREMKTQLAKARAAGVALAIALGARAVEAAFVAPGGYSSERVSAAVALFALAMCVAAAWFVADRRSLDVVLHGGVEGWDQWDPWDDDDASNEGGVANGAGSRGGSRGSVASRRGSRVPRADRAAREEGPAGASDREGSWSRSRSVAAAAETVPSSRASSSSLGPRVRSPPPPPLGAEFRALPPPVPGTPVNAFAPGAPVGVRLSPASPSQWLPPGPSRPPDGVSCPAQVPFAFESELFSGRAVVYLRGLPDSPARVFEGRARAIQFVVQGRFKRPVPMDDVHFGVRLARPLTALPTRWLLSLCTRVVRGLGAKYGMELSDPTHPRPFMTAPLALATQVLACHAPGEEPDIQVPTQVEDVARRQGLWRGSEADAANASGASRMKKNKSLSSSERRSTLARLIRDARRARAKANGGVAPPPRTRPPSDGRVPSFDVDSVWTFSFWQSQIDFAAYDVDLGVGTFDLAKILDGQPLALSATTSDGAEVAFRFEIWHERLLPAAMKAYEVAKETTADGDARGDRPTGREREATREGGEGERATR